MACENGHIDDFPWDEYLHGQPGACPGPLDCAMWVPSGEAADVMLTCSACQKSKPMAPAFSDDGRAGLPTCRGRHPHLRVAPLEECRLAVQPITLGATNMWFSRTLSALSIPSTADPLEQVVEQDLTALFEDAESERDVKLSRKGHARYDNYTDAQIWAAIQKLRAMDGTAPLTPKDLKLPEWKLFSNPDPAKNSPNMRLRVGDAAGEVRAVDRERRTDRAATRSPGAGGIHPAGGGWGRFDRETGAAAARSGSVGASSGSTRRGAVSAALRKESIGVAGGRRDARNAVPSGAPALAIAEETGTIPGFPRAALRFVALLVACSDPAVLGRVRICGGQPEGTHLLLDAR